MERGKAIATTVLEINPYPRGNQVLKGEQLHVDSRNRATPYFANGPAEKLLFQSEQTALTSHGFSFQS